jgi:two-component system CheB/CheR fusion protein
VISHDLKEPLRKIQTFGDRLQVKSNKKLSDEEKKYLDKMISSSLRMKTLIDDLLLYSKLSNKAAMFTNVDLNKIIHQIQDDLEIQVKEKKAKITVGQLPVLPAVPGQMHQFFQNLISNSLKFVQHRAPVISIRQVPVDKKMARQFGIDPSDYVCICLKDNGIGFDDKYKEKIFGVFQRLSTEVNYPGTGIGLAICKRIAENHHGFITANGVLNKGAAFCLILPKKQKKRPEPA